MPKALCSAERFAEVWQAAGTAYEVARKLGLTEDQVTMKACRLRKRFQLKVMGTGSLGARRIAHEKEVEMMRRALELEPDLSLAEYLRRRRPA